MQAAGDWEGKTPKFKGERFGPDALPSRVFGLMPSGIRKLKLSEVRHCSVLYSTLYEDVCMQWRCCHGAQCCCCAASCQCDDWCASHQQLAYNAHMCTTCSNSVKHGRLAMLSILGLVLQELITGQSLMLQMQSYGFNAFLQVHINWQRTSRTEQQTAVQTRKAKLLLSIAGRGNLHPLGGRTLCVSPIKAQLLRAQSGTECALHSQLVLCTEHSHAFIAAGTAAAAADVAA
eukprot:19928-Heterococcus_DN1.PRE.3